MASPSVSFKRPNVTQKTIYNYGFSCVTYDKAVQKANIGGAAVEPDDVLLAFEEDVNRLLSDDPEMMRKLLEQVDSPEVWHCSNTFPLPSSGYFGVQKDSYFYQPAEPRTREEKNKKRTRMVNKVGQEVLAPYYGLSQLSRVSYLEVAQNTVSIIPPGPPSEDLIKNVFYGIIRNIFHFEKPEIQIEVRDQIRAPESRACWEQPTIAAAADKNSKEEKPEEEPKKENEQSSGSKSSEDDFARKIPDHHKPVHDKTLDDQRDGGKSEEKPAHDKSPDNSASDEQSGEDKPIDDKSTDNESVGGKPAEEEQIKGPASGEAAKDKPADEECLEEKTLENKPIEPPAIKIPGLTLTRPMPPTVPPPPLKQSEDESQGKRSLKRKLDTKDLDKNESHSDGKDAYKSESNKSRKFEEGDKEGDDKDDSEEANEGNGEVDDDDDGDDDEDQGLLRIQAIFKSHVCHVSTAKKHDLLKGIIRDNIDDKAELSRFMAEVRRMYD